MLARSVFLRRLLLIVALLLLMLPGWINVHAQAAPCDSSTDYAAAALTAYNAGDYEAALPNLYCATGLDPQNIDLQAAYFQVLLRTGRISTAYGPGAVLSSLDPARFGQIIADAEAALAADPSDQGALIVLLGSIWPIDEARIDQLLALDPESTVAYSYRATKAAYIDGAVEAAGTAIERAVELAPDNPEILSIAAQVYLFGIGNAEQALALIEQAIAADPDFAPIYADRSNYYAQAGDLEMAVESISRAIELNPYNYTNYNQRGLFYLQQEDYSAALDDFRYVLSVNPSSPAALGSVIDISLITGNAADRALAADSFLNARSEIIDGDTLTMDTPLTLSMTGGRMARVPVRLTEGQEVVISAVAADPASLDPLLMVVDPAGGAVAYNDDTDADGGDYSASVMFIPAVSGEYVLLVTHSGGGSEGEMTVTVSPSARQ